LIEVLLLHRRLRRDAVLAGIRAALAAGSVSADVVAIEARKHITTADITTADITTADAVTGAQAGEPAAPQRSRAAVVTLGARRQAASLAGLPADERPAPSVRDYDQLLTRRRAPSPARGPDGGDAGDAQTVEETRSS
jgi:hypothetical protein